MKEKREICLLNLVDIGLRHKILRVEIRTVTNGWIWNKVTTTEKVFTYCDGIWLDGKNRRVIDEDLSYRLQEILVGYLSEKQLTNYITL